MIKKIKVPHTLILLFGIIIVMAMPTWIVPSGQAEMESE